ncbi:MAG TPA: SLC13 family permease [Acidimicrobiales bacterium]|nr:SLC13 family permease [Acidimicrobiales bacterium]
MPNPPVSPTDPKSWALAGIGAAVAGAAAVVSPGHTRSAAGQDWPPFVLVAGLLLIGLVADEDGLFRAAGDRLAALAPGAAALYGASMVLVAVVTALLNLDTSVAFLTPVLVRAGLRRPRAAPALLYGCLFMSNAASLLLPGSNLTNLIVLGHLHLAGGRFFLRMSPSWAAVVVVTTVAVALLGARAAGGRAVAAGPDETGRGAVRGRVGVAATFAAVVLVVVLRSPALPVLGVGLVAVALRLGRGRLAVPAVREVLGLPTLVGLLGVAVGLGALGRAWSGPALLLGHVDRWGTGVVAAGSAVVVNNLPAASLLSARVPPHPFALLVGLDLGPNLAPTGSLAWILWLRSARRAGAEPSLARASGWGAVVVALTLATGLAVLALGGLA